MHLSWGKCLTKIDCCYGKWIDICVSALHYPSTKLFALLHWLQAYFVVVSSNRGAEKLARQKTHKHTAITHTHSSVVVDFFSWKTTSKLQGRLVSFFNQLWSLPCHSLCLSMSKSHTSVTCFHHRRNSSAHVMRAITATSKNEQGNHSKGQCRVLQKVIND